MINLLSELNSQRMLSLTRAALHGITPDESLFIHIGETEWDELFEHAVAQNVMILLLNGTMQLPKELQPPFLLKMRWIASVEAKEKQYQHCLETAEKMSAYFRKNNVRMLLFKGLALSRLYPIPTSREFEDMDIYFCGKAKEGDALLEHIAQKAPSSKKHVNFICEGIWIENHHTFLNHNSYNSFHHSEFLEKRLVAILEEAGMMDEARTDLSDETLLFPPPDFDALYVILHLLTHLPRGRVLLRHLCDLSVLFTAYKGKINFPLYQNTLSEAGLLRASNAYISLSVRYLGLNPEYAPPYESDLSLENRIWNDLLNPEVPPLPGEKRTWFNIFIYKTRLFWSSYWKNELVLPGKYGKRILNSIFYHLFYPESIGKLQYK